MFALVDPQTILIRVTTMINSSFSILFGMLHAKWCAVDGLAGRRFVENASEMKQAEEN
jgi:hypothetical protein